MVIVLVMHGMPPKDFPQKERLEFMQLHSKLSGQGGSLEVKNRHDELEKKMRTWLRTPENDMYFFAAKRLAEELGQSASARVFVCFNEFCAPPVQETFDKAAASGEKEIVVVTPMLTRGGSHAEDEIPKQIEAARARHSHTRFTYAWPFKDKVIAQFLADQLGAFAGK